jgi:deoxyribonuclease V
MKIRPELNLPIELGETRELQRMLSNNVIRKRQNTTPRKIAGIDVSVTRFSKSGRSAIVVLRWPSLEIEEISIAEGTINFPYIPGLLSFREAPLIIQAWERLARQPDLILVDGQGIAHPRRLGIASHLGLLFNVISIGCAKSRLIGTYEPPGDEPGVSSLLYDDSEIVGAVVRTRRSVKPVFVSIGHKIDLQDSISWVLNCCQGFRLPAPIRLAHLAAGGHLNKMPSTGDISKY